MSIKIVNLEPDHYEAVREICKTTGYMGDDIGKIFGDRELFADFFTKYYIDYEADNCYVAIHDGEVAGYIIASLRPLRYLIIGKFLLNIVFLFRLISKLCKNTLDKNDIDLLKWLFLKGTRETPLLPLFSCHFHMNVKKEYRNGCVSSKLLKKLMERGREKKVKLIAFQMQTYDNRRQEYIFKRLGFRLFNSRKTTRFAKFFKKNVYISTFVREIGVK